MSDGTAPKTGLQRILDTVERIGNTMPHPVIIFASLIAFIIVLSTLLSLFGAEVS